MSREPFWPRGLYSGGALVAAAWLAMQLLVRHMADAPFSLRLAIVIGVPFVSGVLAPRSWRRDIAAIAVPFSIASWLVMAPWSGTSDTPPGWHWIEVSFGIAAINVGMQYLGFVLGVACSRLAALAAGARSG